jgi:molybdate/tungstate transport system substrate-binding protein
MLTTSRSTRHARRALVPLVLAGSLVALPVAAGASPPAKAAKGSGPVDVYYAASLQDTFESHIGPHFDKATGYTFTGFSGASGTLANEIKGGVVAGDVFVSASSATNNALEGASNGNWVSWYIAFANSPLVIGYNPHSAFAAALKRGPWFKVITQPGFLIGRTDPAVDPKGKLTVQAIDAAIEVYGASGLSSVIASSANVFPEQSLVGELQAGQLAAGFFYRSEAVAAGIPFVTLGKLFLAATYTVTVLANAPHEAAAEAFVRYLLSTPGASLLRKEGLTVVKPRLIGVTTSMPRSLRSLVPTT